MDPCGQKVMKFGPKIVKYSTCRWRHCLILWSCYLVLFYLQVSLKGASDSCTNVHTLGVNSGLLKVETNEISGFGNTEGFWHNLESMQVDCTGSARGFICCQCIPSKQLTCHQERESATYLCMVRQKRSSTHVFERFTEQVFSHSYVIGPSPRMSEVSPKVNDP